MEHLAESKFHAAQSLNMSAAIFTNDGQLVSLVLRDRYRHANFGFPELRGLRWLEFIHAEDFEFVHQLLRSPRSTASFRFYAPMARRWFDVGLDMEPIGSFQFCLLHINPSLPRHQSLG